MLLPACLERALLTRGPVALTRALLGRAERFLGRVGPSDCHILIGEALEREAFELQARAEGTHAHGLIQRRGPDRAYEKYWAPVVRQVRGMIRDLEGLGATVNDYATLDDIGAASAKYRVLVLVTHWAGRAIQIQEQLVTVDRLIAAFPSGRKMTVDFGVCEGAQELMSALHAARPGVRLVCVDGESNLPFHLAVVRATLRTLSEFPRPYEVAFSEVASEMMLQRDLIIGAEEDWAMRLTLRSIGFADSAA